MEDCDSVALTPEGPKDGVVYIVAKLPLRLVRIIDRLPALRLRVRRKITRAARPIASLARALAIALLAVLGGLLMSPAAANADPSCEVPPSGLASALNDAASGIVLTWDASSCTPDEYAVYRRNMDEAGSRMRLFATVDGATLSYADTSVEAGVTYRYRIRSNDKGPRSASTEFTVPAPKSDTDDTETSEGTPGTHNSDPNIDAVFYGSGMRTFSVPENTVLTDVGDPLLGYDADGDTMYYSLTGTDSSGFTIGRDGQLMTTLVFDFEAKRSYSLNAHVRDSWDTDGHPDLTIDDTMTVTIAIVNEDDPGVLLISGTPARGELLTASLSDPDGNPHNLSWRWQRENSTGTSWLSIAGATSDTYTLVPGDVGTRVQARVSYIDNHGIAKSATATTATVAPTRNVGPPVFTVSEATRTLSENLEAGTLVGAPVVAADPEGDTLTYWLGGPDSVSFRIDQNGQITTKLPLDYEVQSRYRMDAHVRDGLDGAGNEDEAVDDTITVTIDIVNEDDPGVVLISGTPTVHELLTASLSDHDNPTA